MPANIIQGADKNLIVRINSGDTQDPYDLTGVEFISACFTKTDGSQLHQYYLKKTGDLTSASDIITNISTINLEVGQRIQGVGIPSGARIIELPTTPNTVRISAPATATASGQALEIVDILIVRAEWGKIKIQLDEEDTNLLESGEGKNFEVKVIKNGFTSYLQFAEELNVVERFC